ncbi:MAG: phenylalanine--tRNA ligase subunit beta, partial [bacterium]|nr:phenylalanine--tRNA ligase subunit beta [bacterium]MDW8164739.1 phenylalanine--tRNA ligase subunit beta [Candidatus Omnitrophota bacterium]
MKYTYKTLLNYFIDEIKKDEIFKFLEILGLTPKIIKEENDDIIFEIETPANRPDLLSFLGLAKEISPFVKIPLKNPEIKKLEEEILDFIPIEIENENDCFYYSCRIIKDIDNHQSHGQIKKILENVGFRSSFLVVDISNFVMCEIGQPLHIFDLDKIKEKIIVRKGKKGEKLITIDGKERDVEDILIIADVEKPIAIAGIMGGINSEVTSNTKNILIESAYFNPVIIRKGSKKLGLVSEASIRFEKGLSVSLAKMGMERATKMIKELCGGKIGKESFSGKQINEGNEIIFKKESVEKIIGIRVRKEFIRNLFEKLGFSYKEFRKDKIYVIKVPENRKDLKEEIDIVEEIAKYSMYSSIPLEMPKVNLKPFIHNSNYYTISKIKEILVNFGFCEVITLSFISEKLVENFKLDAIKIENPISQSFSFLRCSLIFNMLEVMKYNISHQNKELEIFEIGRVYKKIGDKYNEIDSLMIMSLNRGTFFDFKGKIESFFEKFGVVEIENIMTENFYAEDNNNCDIYYQNEKIGSLFLVSDKLKKFYGINEEIYACEIEIGLISKFINQDKKFKKLPIFPAAKRDFSFLLPEDINWKM